MTVKTDNSLRSQGLTCIAIDKPTRAKLKALAESENLPLSHYLRVVANRELKGKNIPFGMGSGGSEASVSQVSQKLDDVMVKVESLDTAFFKAFNFLSETLTTAWATAFDKGVSTEAEARCRADIERLLDILRERVYKLAESRQGKLSLKEGTG